MQFPFQFIFGDSCCWWYVSGPLFPVPHYGTHASHTQLIMARAYKASRWALGANLARAFPCCSSSLFSLADMCSLPVVSRGYEARPPSTYHHTVLAPLAPHPPTDSGPRRPLRPLMGLHPSGWDSKRVPQQHAPQTQKGPFQVEMCPGTPPKCPRGVVLNMLYCFIMVTFWRPFW